MSHQTIEISKIDASGRLRPLNPIWITTYAEALAEGDELPAIEVVERKAGYRLVTGAHRLAAHLEAGRNEIEARVYSTAEFADEAAIRLREIRANMMQIELTALDRSIHLATWKELYEAANSTNRRGGKRRGAEVETNSQDFAKRFSLAAAEALDVSERSVQIAVQIAAGIVPTVRARIALAPIARVASELLQLAHQDPLRQERIVGLLLASPPSVTSVADAIALLDHVPQPIRLTAWEKVSDRFGRLDERQQSAFFDAHADAIDRWIATRRSRAA